MRWETRFYRAHDAFPTHIPEATECDVVIGILGARLGSELRNAFPKRMTNGGTRARAKRV